MMNFTEKLNLILEDAFDRAGYDRAYGRIVPSNRPDLCEFQCNGAMAAAKAYRMAPIRIAEAVVPYLASNPAFKTVSACMPGFINLDVSEAFLRAFLKESAALPGFGAAGHAGKKILIDYGGPNVAKPLHIGHLRSAVIGEALKRMLRFAGNEVIGDTHLGDWGLQIGLIIEQLKEEKPDLPYFDPDFDGDYPEEAPFTISELETIYPKASARAKTDQAFSDAAHENTYQLQQGDPACTAIWKQIIRVSVEDLKKNYANLGVSFELWKGESDAEPYIPTLLMTLEEQGLSYVSDGAIVVDVQEEGDKTEIPPCLIMKSDGAALYQTTDLATIIDRMEHFNPDEIIYITDKRQELHFRQVFRVARKANLVNEDTELVHIGFGTMNGKDGKPFKTRAGGVMRLEALIAEINDAVREKMRERYEGEELDEETVKAVGLSAIKYGDLSNQAAKDYNFDIDRFSSFEGNTGPYILYTIVRIKSILRKAGFTTLDPERLSDLPSGNPKLKELMMDLCGFGEMMEAAIRDLAPHKICGYIYGLCDTLNSFYHETHILNEEDEGIRQSYLCLLLMTQQVLETCIGLLGFSAPEKM
ncbi:MAG: arginine--tRNA ligase [Lachnospiraceae bacterium]|nr:arginine--tRNA ligase [Lachnospiraceae bacterium]